jgi:outer membrane protein TolC
VGRNDWNVSLNIRLNLLDFGERSANVQSKRVTAKINRARLDFSRLNAKRRWVNFVENFNSKKREFTSIKNALKRSQTSYKEQLKDLKRGLVSQIEVIRSLDDVISLEKLAIRSALEVKSIYYQANAYLGKYPKG